MAFGQLGDFREGVVNLLAAIVGQAQLYRALDRQADFGEVHLGLVPGDHATGFQLGYALGHGGGGEVDRAGQLREGGAAVFKQGAEEHSVVFVHDKAPVARGFRKRGL